MVFLQIWEIEREKRLLCYIRAYMRNVVMNLKWSRESCFMFFSICIHLHMCRWRDDGSMNSTGAAVIFLSCN